MCLPIWSPPERGRTRPPRAPPGAHQSWAGLDPPEPQSPPERGRTRPPGPRSPPERGRTRLPRDLEPTRAGSGLDLPGPQSPPKWGQDSRPPRALEPTRAGSGLDVSGPRRPPLHPTPNGLASSSSFPPNVSWVFIGPQPSAFPLKASPGFSLGRTGCPVMTVPRPCTLGTVRGQAAP